MRIRVITEYTHVLKTAGHFLSQKASQRRIRKGAAVLFYLLSVVIFVSCGEDNKKAARVAADSGLKALAHNDLDAAQKYFLYALKKNPLNSNANFGLARLNDQFYQDNSEAVKYYRRYLDIVQYGSFHSQTKSALKILEKINSGKVEDPVNFLQDFVLLVDSNQQDELIKRLSSNYIAQSAARGLNPPKIFEAFSQLFLGHVVVVAKRRFMKDDTEAVLIIGLKKGNPVKPEKRVIYSAKSGLKAVDEYYAFELARADEENFGLWRLMSYSKLTESK